MDTLLFDLDDTLISFDGVTEFSWTQAVDRFLERQGGTASKAEMVGRILETRDWYWSDPERHRLGRKNIQQARREVVRLALGSQGTYPGAELDRLADEYSAIHWQAVHVFDASQAVLESFRSQGVSLYLVTNGTSKEQRDKIERFDLGKFFDGIYIEEEMGFGKPDPRVFPHVLSSANLKPEQVAMIGDNYLWDLKAPKSAGIFGVWLNSKKKALTFEPGSEPDMVIETIGDLLRPEIREKLILRSTP